MSAQIFQGRFTSAGEAVTIALRSGIDWMEVYNYSVADADSQTTAVGVQFYWQRGMADGYGWEYKKSNAANAAQLSTIISSGGFSYVDTSLSPLGAYNTTISSVSADAIPLVTNTGVNGLVAGDVVRLYNIVGGQQLGGYDFTVGHNTISNTTFTLDYMPAIIAATTGKWRKIKFDPLYYPRHRYITQISQATEAVVTLSVTHQYKIGQKVRMVVPSEFGMVEMDGLQATIKDIDTTEASGNTITLDIDSSAFTAFSFPLTAAAPFSPAMVVPIGMDTADALAANVNILSDATENDGYIGMTLAAGADSPAGQSGNVIYWRAGTSFFVDNN
jgi:hypothetical protein